MVQFKHVLVMLTVAVLFSVLSYSIGTAIHEQPRYEDFCSQSSRPYIAPKENCTMPSQNVSQEQECSAKGGNLQPVIGPSGCYESYECDTCSAQLDSAQESFRLVIFLVMSLLGVAAIIAGMLINSKDEIVSWVLNGFVLGGLVTLFIGTIVYFSDAPRFLRPLIMLFELGLIIFLAVRKLGTSKPARRKH